MDKCGFSINSFEPDPIHVGVFQENIVNNKSVNITINQKAISDKSGTMDFIRVLGNTTGSHLAGAKEDPYGELETFSVETSDINAVLLYVSQCFSALYCSLANPIYAIPPTSTRILQTSLAWRDRVCLKTA